MRGLSLAGGDGSNHPAWWSSEVRRMELVLKLQYLGQLMATNVGQCSLKTIIFGFTTKEIGRLCRDPDS